DPAEAARIDLDERFRERLEVFQALGERGRPLRVRARREVLAERARYGRLGVPEAARGIARLDEDPDVAEGVDRLDLDLEPLAEEADRRVHLELDELVVALERDLVHAADLVAEDEDGVLL